MSRHNPERRAWRGKSYRKGGTVAELKATPDPESEDTEEACAVCDGPLVLLGCLGNTAHFRCRDCGIESYRRAR